MAPAGWYSRKCQVLISNRDALVLQTPEAKHSMHSSKKFIPTLAFNRMINTDTNPIAETWQIFYLGILAPAFILKKTMTQLDTKQCIDWPLCKRKPTHYLQKYCTL